MFDSILFPSGAAPAEPASDDTSHDLALDMLFAKFGEDSSRAFRALRIPLRDVETVRYRQEIFRSLEFPPLRKLIKSFMAELQASVQADEETRHASYPYEAELDHLRGLLTYVSAVDEFGSKMQMVLERSQACRRHLRAFPG